jgi:hypothetical protein
LFLQCNSCIFHREYTSDPVFWRCHGISLIWMQLSFLIIE